MCKYTLKNQKLKKNKIKNSSRGLHDSTEGPKIRRLWRKGYQKNNKDLSMLQTRRM